MKMSRKVFVSLFLLSSHLTHPSVIVELVALGQEEEADPPQPFRWRVGEEED
jgi:hypothetical protein